MTDTPETRARKAEGLGYYADPRDGGLANDRPRFNWPALAAAVAGAFIAGAVAALVLG